MASNIVADTIDDTYPVAGQDNNSQGFRDNFNIIKTNFTAAKSEIETLQNNTAKTNADNVFFENTLSRYVKNQETSSHVDGLSGVSSSADLSFAGAHYFTSTEFGGGAAITTNTVTTRSHVVKAFTYDNGATVFLQYLGTFSATS
mgnify:CR=1 FL=1